MPLPGEFDASQGCLEALMETFAQFLEILGARFLFQEGGEKNGPKQAVG
jgi:hypothetical protein